jgi:hypothetical protein
MSITFATVCYKFSRLYLQNRSIEMYPTWGLKILTAATMKMWRHVSWKYYSSTLKMEEIGSFEGPVTIY